ncbi:2-phosphoxylose phosphatase 1 [Latimeria chalumnae]|uniref:2-phosphoxylose phosphatase 1 n=1 Tax=Latimeria chalumnae TaxID=7897 RepID=M3XL72_LATCH|nr:PREDICTED: 2-phosphoxylose phosphatase 1 [Latimeria chalumnae]|eukprot:XP_014344524.1 PREDICTED: 2-phosphoxylose phosphatase 1 [Latimeria chalumnae]
MLFRNRFLFLLVVAALLAFLSLSLQFLHLIPVTIIKDNGLNAKNRKKVMPDLFTEPPVVDPIYEANAYCNIPNITEHGFEGHAPPDHRLLSVHVMIRHGDRYPLYAIPKTKRPAIDCILAPDRKPSHPHLEAFVNHMSKPTKGHMDSSLNGLPRYPSHSVCETGELTQTGVVQHLLNGQHLRDIYIRKHKLLPSDWTTKHLYVESTGKSRTLQSGLALLYSLLPDFEWQKLVIRHQWSTIFCSSSCDCPMRNHYLEEEQRRQYNLRMKNSQLEQTYVDMAKIVGVPTRQLRAANPIDSLLCHFCHNISFPCTESGCIDREHFKVIKAHQLEDEQERREKKLYYKYALLATHPLLNQTVSRMHHVLRGKKEEVFALYSAHDVTVSPVLNALGLLEARFPRFAARLIFELWQGPKNKNYFIRILYNGDDVTFQTSFCRKHNRHSKWPLCPFENFASFVQKEMFAVFNSTDYYDACHRRVF